MEQAVRADGVRRLVLRLHRGDVTLSDSGGSHVEGTIDAATEPRVDQHGSWLTIQSRQPADVRLAVPAGIDVEIRTRTGDLTARVALGSVSVQAGSGDVRLTQVTGHADVTSDSGDLDLGRIEGAGRIRSGSGTITIGHLRGTVAIKSGSGDVSVASNQGELFVKAGSGDVSVGVPEGTRTWLDLISATGDVRVLLPGGEPGDTDQAGRGHASIQVVTATGDIQVLRA